MIERVERELLQQGQWTISYRSDCPVYDCWRQGKCIIVARMGYSVEKHWHPARFWGRNRTLMECLCEALDWIAQQNAESAVAHEEANLLKEEAQALAEAATSLAAL